MKSPSRNSDYGCSSVIMRLCGAFRHADRGLIAFGGFINSTAVASPDVELYINSAGQSLIALDSSSLLFLRNGGKFGPNSNPNQYDLSSLKDRFARDAGIVIFFACHTGSDATLLQDFSDTLKVKVIGFTSAIAYCPAFTTSSPAINLQMDIAFGSCGSTHMTNFHQYPMATTSLIYRVPSATP